MFFLFGPERSLHVLVEESNDLFRMSAEVNVTVLEGCRGEFTAEAQSTQRKMFMNRNLCELGISAVNVLLFGPSAHCMCLLKKAMTFSGCLPK
jgi:hypothetical protein